MNGLVALEEMQQVEGWRETPVFLVTAANLTEEVAAKTREMVQVSMGRPLTADEMGATLNALLSALNPTIAADSAAPGLR